MIHIGMHVDNWRHQDAPLKVPCEFAAKHGLKHIELGSIWGDYFVQALGYNPHVPLHSDPLRLKKYMDSLGLQVSQIDAAYPISFPEGSTAESPIRSTRSSLPGRWTAPAWIRRTARPSPRATPTTR